MLRDGAKYYGPYTSSGDVKQTLSLLERIFPLRKCKSCDLPDGMRACLNYHIKLCSGPCIGAIDEEQYRELVKDVCLFLDGHGDKVIKNMRTQMETAAEKLDFEAAAKLRDRINAIGRVLEKQKVLVAAGGDKDIVAAAGAGDSCMVQILVVRSGKLIRLESFLLEGVEGLTSGEIMGEALKCYYSEAAEIPPELIVADEPEEIRLLEEWLCDLRQHKCSLKANVRGTNLGLLKMAQENAVFAWEKHQRVTTKHTAMTQGALLELAEKLTLGHAIKRIECYDISNIQGTEAVGSMVVFTDGIPDKQAYRRFRIETVQGQNDFAMMHEVLMRRFNRAELERSGEKSAGFIDMPDLLVIDGGKGQLGVAIDILEMFGRQDIAVIGLAKRLEEVFLPGCPDPVILPENSEGLMLLRRIRDEAHRFAVMYHRKLRDKRTFQSMLDDVPGIGPARRKKLLQIFGSVETISTTSPEDIVKLAELPYEVGRNNGCFFAKTVERGRK